MLKLYRLQGDHRDYWETWEEATGKHRVHWGTLGTSGESKVIESTLFQKAEKIIQKEVDWRISEGFAPISPEEHSKLLIEYPIEGMGSEEDLLKRHNLEDRMNETLGWTGLGACDGGSIGSGSMEVCCFVVDFNAAKQVIEADLEGTEFGDYSRIYDEGID